MTDEAGRTVWKAEYRPFGDLESIDTDPDGDGVPVENNLRFPGQYDDALASLLMAQGPYYNWHRYYEPGTGRYLQSDPLLMPSPNLAVPSNVAEILAATPALLHLYSYATDSPTMGIDPMGLLRCLPWATVTPAGELTVTYSHRRKGWSRVTWEVVGEVCHCYFSKLTTGPGKCTCWQGHEHPKPYRQTEDFESTFQSPAATEDRGLVPKEVSGAACVENCDAELKRLAESVSGR